MPIALRWNNEKGAAELQRTPDGALAEDTSLETIVLLSLFTDAPATADELVAAKLVEQLGWWAHSDNIRGTDRIFGSKLWLLSRGGTTRATLRRAEQYAVDALRWLIDLAIAKQVEVTATRPRPGELALDIKITRPQKLLPPFERLWKVRTHALL